MGLRARCLGVNQGRKIRGNRFERDGVQDGRASGSTIWYGYETKAW